MTDTDAVGLDPNPILTDTTATVTMIPTEDAPGHIIRTTDNITGVLHDAHTQMLISTILTMTLHIEGHLLIDGHWLIHEIEDDHTLDQPTGQLRKPHIRIHHIPEDPSVICAIKELPE